MQTRLPIVVRSGEGVELDMPGGSYGRRMISAAVSKKMGMGVLYVNRGQSPHRWHRHDRPDKSGSYEINYPKGFEESYLIVQGEGIVQWKVEEKIYEKEVRTGDAVYFPEGVCEHQVLNNSDKPMIVVYAFVPAVGA